MRCLIGLLCVLGSCAGATPGFVLGVDYSEWAPPSITQIATDASGAIYLLSSYPREGSNTPPSTVTKLTADDKTIVWQNALTVAVAAMAVSAAGDVFVVPFQFTGIGLPGSVAKLNVSGSGIAWTLSIGLTFGTAPMLAADVGGRVYVAGGELSGPTGAVARVNAQGTAVDYITAITGIPTSIGVDGSGAAFVAGFGGKGIFLERVTPDGSIGFFSSVAGQEAAPAVALDSNGQEVVYASGKFQRYDASGALVSSSAIQSFDFNTQALLLDASGNAYVAGSTIAMYPVRNTLATCGSDVLSVVARDGTVLQTTYIPGAINSGGAPLIVLGAQSNVLVVDGADTSATPSRSGPYMAGAGAGAQFLTQLSPNPDAPILALGCIGNAASFAKGRVAPGTILTLFGSNLGPQQGIQTTASLQSPFPKEVQSLQVTFDGTPAPLLWVQESQINLIAPGSLTPGQSSRICLASRLGFTSNCITQTVAQVSPGVFTVSGYAAAVNQDGSINSADHPAPVGSIVSIFATGLGPISPAQADGTLVNLPLPANLLSAQVVTPNLASPFGGPPQGYSPLQVTYAGPAPFLVTGASQINLVVAPGVDYVQVGTTQSQGFQLHIRGVF